MNQLRPLVKNERVSHREDYDWDSGDGFVTFIDGSGYIAYVLWDNLPGLEGPFNREELVAMDDPDIKSARDLDV